MNEHTLKRINIGLNELYVNRVFLGEQSLHIFEMLPPSAESMFKTTDFRSFQGGTVDVSRLKGCKNTVHKTLRMLPSSRYQTWAVHVQWADRQNCFQISNFVVLLPTQMNSTLKRSKIYH